MAGADVLRGGKNFLFCFGFDIAGEEKGILSVEKTEIDRSFVGLVGRFAEEGFGWVDNV